MKDKDNVLGIDLEPTDEICAETLEELSNGKGDDE